MPDPRTEWMRRNFFGQEVPDELLQRMMGPAFPPAQNGPPLPAAANLPAPGAPPVAAPPETGTFGNMFNQLFRTPVASNQEEARGLGFYQTPTPPKPMEPFWQGALPSVQGVPSFFGGGGGQFRNSQPQAHPDFGNQIGLNARVPELGIRPQDLASLGLPPNNPLSIYDTINDPDLRFSPRGSQTTPIEVLMRRSIGAPPSGNDFRQFGLRENAPIQYPGLSANEFGQTTQAWAAQEGLRQNALDRVLGRYNDQANNFLNQFGVQSGHDVARQGQVLQDMQERMRALGVPGVPGALQTAATNAATNRMQVEGALTNPNQMRQMVQTLVNAGVPYIDAERQVRESPLFSGQTSLPPPIYGQGPPLPGGNAPAISSGGVIQRPGNVVQPPTSLSATLEDAYTRAEQTHGEIAQGSRTRQIKPGSRNLAITDFVNSLPPDAFNGQQNLNQTMQFMIRRFGSSAVDPWFNTRFGRLGRETPHEQAIQRISGAANSVVPGTVGSSSRNPRTPGLLGLGGSLFTLGL